MMLPSELETIHLILILMLYLALYEQNLVLPDVPSVMVYVIVYSPIGNGWSRINVIGINASVALLYELRFPRNLQE